MKRPTDVDAVVRETDIARPVITWLEDMHWDVYQEVEIPGGIVDIAARQGPLLWAIEVKRTLSLTVLAQAWHRTRYFHLVSVAVPHARMSDGRHFALRIMESYGIGMFTVGDVGDVAVHDQYRTRERLNRHALSTSVSLLDEHRYWAEAGNADGRRFTSFQGTCRAVLDTVKQRPGLCLRELVDAVDHHYASDSSARSCLSRWIQKGIVPGVEARREGDRLNIYEVSP